MYLKENQKKAIQEKISATCLTERGLIFLTYGDYIKVNKVITTGWARDTYTSKLLLSHIVCGSVFFGRGKVVTASTTFIVLHSSASVSHAQPRPVTVGATLGLDSFFQFNVSPATRFCSKSKKSQLGLHYSLCCFLSQPPKQKVINPMQTLHRLLREWRGLLFQGGFIWDFPAPPPLLPAHPQDLALFIFPFALYLVKFLLFFFSLEVIRSRNLLLVCLSFSIFLPARDIEMENHSLFSCLFGVRQNKGVHGWLHALVEISLGCSSPSWESKW